MCALCREVLGASRRRHFHFLLCPPEVLSEIPSGASAAAADQLHFII